MQSLSHPAKEDFRTFLGNAKAIVCLAFLAASTVPEIVNRDAESSPEVYQDNVSRPAEGPLI